MPTLEERVKLLEDLEAIRRLKIAYARAVDERVPGAQYAALFTEDAELDGGLVGEAKGRAQITEFFEEAKKKLPFFLHYMMGQTIDVDGDDATGHWYLWEPATAESGEPIWIAITYNDRYKRVDGEWKIDYSKLNFHFATPYDKGWVQQQFIET
ncbi:MAG: nuclear transport factor 2 family protein [Chloroflexi bacterium]|nr:nuclear transport factor 2 family protein [Chloroflexota bacterium]